MIRAFVIMVALSASALSAECLTRADVENGGVHVTLDDGSKIHYRALDGDVIGEFHTQPGDETDFLYGMYRGIYLIIDADLKDGEIVRESLLTYQPSDETIPFPKIQVGAAWQGEFIMREEDGTFYGRFEYDLSVVDAGPISISNCEYETLRVRIDEQFGNEDSSIEYRYLTDLGISIATAYGTIGAPPTSFVSPLTLTTEPPK